EVLLLGYTPKRMPVDVPPGAAFRVTVVLDPVILETVEVSANAAFSRAMGGFEERRAKGVGRFFTREQIVKMQARQVTDVLRRVPGMRIQTGSGAFGGGSLTAHSGRSVGTTSARVCPLAYYVNGAPFPLPGDVPINHYLTPDEIVGIEVYSSGSQIPTQFTSTMPNSRCGLAVIWTRDGIDPRVAR
ncbi:MAG TPA: Plug domain-containing protein, partial [Gemmatimonadaceae bacterium]|nr:Plug domain-containing protein [Gemmatimonadaceae bacterium]